VVQADEAVREIGTNAIPMLLQMLCAKDSPLVVKLLAVAGKQHLIKIRHPPAGNRNIQAYDAFKQLGTQAGVAVPALIEISRQKISAESRAETALVLGEIGPAASNAMPVLIAGAGDPSDYVRDFTVRALGQIHAQPEVVVPVLINSLQDANTYVRTGAAISLAQYRNAAWPAVPALVTLVNQAQGDLRYAAAEALVAIDPLKAAGAGLSLRDWVNPLFRPDANTGGTNDILFFLHARVPRPDLDQLP